MAIVLVSLDIAQAIGHDIGDKVLISFVETCKRMVRENDIFARFGGEEFVLFLPDTDKTTAIEIAKRINVAINDIKIDSVPDLNVAVSIGISHNTLNMEKLLNEADKALYKAKNSGRNTFVLYSNV